MKTPTSNINAALSFLLRCPSARIFPARWDKSDNTHKPLIRWSIGSSSDPAQLKDWQRKWPDAYFCINLGVSGLSVLDVDSKHGKEGHVTLSDHLLEGRVLPPTFTVKTPSGNGEHHYFLGECKNSVGKLDGKTGRVVGLGVGLDTRGIGGMVPVPGSDVAGKGVYTIKNDAPFAALPSWIPETLGLPTQRQAKDSAPMCEPDLAYNVQRAIEYLEEQAPVAEEGDGGDNTTVQVAFRLHDLGISEPRAFELMLEHWNEAKADPPWRAEELAVKVQNAYRYPQNRFGCDTSEADFANTPSVEDDSPAAPGSDQTTPSRGVSSIEDDWTPTALPWPVLANAALPGIVGEFVRLATRNSEADPAAVLATFLVRFGAEVTGHSPGQGPYMMVGDTMHKPRLFAAIVGNSSKARKGTSAGPVKSLFTFNDFDEYAPATCSPGPLSSGEGLIYAVRDEVQQWQIDKKTGSGQSVTIDPGVSDKRLFILDEELAAALHSTKREGNTLSSIMRGLWDSGDAAPLTKANRIKTTGAHICILTHITNHELSGLLESVQAFNGFGNRFLWVCARRQGSEPFPKPMPESELSVLQKRLLQRIRAAQEADEMCLDDSAQALWGKAYLNLSKDHPGLAGCVINRAEAQAMRLAMIYALLDGKTEIERGHLQSALAFWDYCRVSALNIFGGRGVDPLAEKVIQALRGGDRTTTELHKALAGHVSAERLKATVETMAHDGRVEVVRSTTGGRPRNLFRLKGKSEESEERGTPCLGQTLSSHNSLNSLEREQKMMGVGSGVVCDVRNIDWLE